MGVMVAYCLALSPHIKTVPGLTPGCFCVQFVHSPHVSQVQRFRDSKSPTGVNVNVLVCLFVFIHLCVSHLCVSPVIDQYPNLEQE